MGKVFHNDVYDGALSVVANHGTRMFHCTQEPANWTQASATYALAAQELVTGDGNGVYVLDDGDTSGRKLTVLEQAGIAVLADGTATHVAICDHVAQKVLAVVPIEDLVCSEGQTITQGEITIPIAIAA